MPISSEIQLLKHGQIITCPQSVAVSKLVACNLLPLPIRIPQKIDSAYALVLMLEMIAHINEVNGYAVIFENPFSFSQNSLNIFPWNMFKDRCGDMIIHTCIAAGKSVFAASAGAR